MVSSLLKHEQLSLDKYQLGRIIALTPRALENNIIDEFEYVSKTALHPIVASTFLLLNEIYNEKLPVSIQAPATTVQEQVPGHALTR